MRYTREDTGSSAVFWDNRTVGKQKDLEYTSGEARAFPDAGGRQHKSWTSKPLGRAQLIQILQGLCPIDKPLAGFYKAFFVLGPLPIHGKSQNVSCL